MTENDPLNNPPAPAPAPVPAPEPQPRAGKKITCSFCKCELTQNGDYFVMSDEAKSLRDAKDENTKLTERVRTLEGELQALKALPPKPERSGAYPFR